MLGRAPEPRKEMLPVEPDEAEFKRRFRARCDAAGCLVSAGNALEQPRQK